MDCSSPRYDVVGLGSTVLDILTLVDQFPAGESVQQAAAIEMQGGGPVATALVALARLGARTAMLTIVGDDWRGQYLLQELQREGVATSQIVQQPNCSSFAACIFVRKQDGARAITYLPGSGPELVLTEAQRTVIQQARILHLNGRYFSACREAARWIHQCGGRVSFDGGAHRYQPQLRQLVPMTDICIVARDFAEQYTTTADLERAAAILLDEGPELVVITDGANGSWVFANDGTQFQQPAYLLPNVVDTTGCGDSYHGAFLFGLIKGMTLRECARLASAVAALNAQQLGGRSGLPNLAQVQAFLS